MHSMDSGYLERGTRQNTVGEQTLRPTTDLLYKLKFLKEFFYCQVKMFRLRRLITSHITYPQTCKYFHIVHLLFNTFRQFV